MKIKDFKSYSEDATRYKKAILDFNNIAEDDTESLPEIGTETILEALSKLEPIDKGNEFVEFIKNHKNEKFCVVGDYDCDGIMATSIISYALSLCGIETTFTVPDRFEDGYGMKTIQIDTAIESGATVVVTVDNGITANDAIDYAHSKGLSVVVTDHHTPQEDNHADLCIDPLYNDDKFKGLSGATVALKLAYCLYKEFNFSDEAMINFACMAVITIYSDVMPMLSENRRLVKAVEPFLNESVNVKDSFINRLSRMIDFYVPGHEYEFMFGIQGTFRRFNKNNIEFYFVPIINAVNRVTGDVSELIYDIMSLFVKDYDGIPHLYSDINKKRKYMKTELTRLHKRDDSVKAVVEILNPKYETDYDNNYSGIAGLIASNIVETENKPAIIGIDDGGDELHFSGRSVGGFNLFNALSEIKLDHPELEFNFGGHAEALGVSCKRDAVPKLQEYLSEKYEVVPEEKVERIFFNIDDINEIKNAYRNLWPFGNKFEFPKFYIDDYVNFIYKENRTFTIKSLGDTEIQYFTKDIQNMVADLAFKHRDKKLKCILSFIENDNAELVLKVEKILGENETL